MLVHSLYRHVDSLTLSPSHSLTHSLTRSLTRSELRVGRLAFATLGPAEFPRLAGLQAFLQSKAQASQNDKFMVCVRLELTEATRSTARILDSHGRASTQNFLQHCKKSSSPARIGSDCSGADHLSRNSYCTQVLTRTGTAAGTLYYSYRTAVEFRTLRRRTFATYCMPRCRS